MGGRRSGLADPGDPDEYRKTPIGEREADPRHAPTVSEIVDGNARGDFTAARQAARDLSGNVTTRKGHTFLVDLTEDGGNISGVVRFPPAQDGLIGRSFWRDKDGKLVVHHDAQILEDVRAQNKGFASAYGRRLEAWYGRSGVDRIEVHASDKVGGYAWAKDGFGWQPSRVRQSIDNVVDRLYTVRAEPGLSREARAEIDDMLLRLKGERGEVRPLPDLPSPGEIAEMKARGAKDLGKRVMLESDWYGVKPL